MKQRLIIVAAGTLVAAFASTARATVYSLQTERSKPIIT
jgi:hypothetical protein